MEAILVKSCMICTLGLLITVRMVSSYPYYDSQDMRKSVWKNDVKKADVFMSRGWGAGGMPFNVLYTQPPKNVGRVPQALPLQMAEAIDEPFIADAQPLRAERTEPFSYNAKPARRQYSVIPQLFVSYGWGPLGRK